MSGRTVRETPERLRGRLGTSHGRAAVTPAISLL